MNDPPMKKRRLGGSTLEVSVVGLGEDLSIGYLFHDAEHVRLYFQESFSFAAYTAEASVAITGSRSG